MPLKQKLLIFVVAYNAEKTLEKVLARIPHVLGNAFEVQILAIDDASSDRTFEVGAAVEAKGTVPFPLKVLVNPVNQGYGGNQKLGYQFAIRHGFDFVALLHGDGQYAPEILPTLLEPLVQNRCDAVFGSRMLVKGAARQGGMPFYKMIGNRILTRIENWLLRTDLSEFHSGYRIYSVSALKHIPFEKNTNDFHFDTEIIIQLVVASKTIIELPIPTYYGDEICHVNGLRYAKDVVLSVLKAKAQDWSIMYDPRFDCAAPVASNQQYKLKLGYQSTHQEVLDLVPEGARVLELGCAGGWLATLLKSVKKCRVAGVDAYPLSADADLDEFVLHDLNEGLPAVARQPFDFVLLMDVIEHLHNPEETMSQLRSVMSAHEGCKLVISTGNIAFLPVRLMLLIGQFNYGKRGILDLTHTRLFTFKSMRRLLEQSGFEIVETRGIAAPFPLAFGDGWLGRALVSVNAVAAKMFRSLFSYQMLFIAEAMPLVTQLLDQAQAASLARAERPRLRKDSPLPVLNRP